MRVVKSSATALLVLLASLSPLDAQTQCTPAPIEGQEVIDAVREAVIDTATTRPSDTDAANARRIVDRVKAQFKLSQADFILRCVPESSRAKSTSSSTSNSSSTRLVDPAAFTDMISLALNRQGVVGSNENAVTVNVNALAFAAARRPDVYTTPAQFRDASLPRRFAGSFTFGAEVPKKDIVGFSGIPDAEKLLEAVSWDLRARVIGDRDPRAQEWSDELDKIVVDGQLNAQVVGAARQVQVDAIQAPDTARIRAMTLGLADAIQDALNEDAGASLESIKADLQSSWVVTLRSSGQHVTMSEDASKYSVSLLADRGFGSLNFTFNATYSHASQSAASMLASDADPSAGPLAGMPLQSADNLDIAAGLTGTVLQNVVAPGRGAELTVSAKAIVPLAEEFGSLPDGGALPADMMQRETEYKVSATLDLPFGDSAKIPLSLIYTNDANALVDQKFIEGRLGVSWDFDAVTKVLKNMAGAG